LSWLDAGWKTFGWWWVRRGGYDQDFHTYTLEWDQDFMSSSFNFPGYSILTLFS
jgi:hypothetical protein